MDREKISRFIERYKSHSCLWNVSSPDYMNKQKRMSALQDMVPILGEAATIDSVRRKIDIIRNGYFRELKKVNASTSIGTSANNVYTPTLWYFELMTFLSSEEVSRPGTDDLDESGTNASGEGPSQIRRKKRGTTKTQEELVNVAKRLLTEDNSAADQDNTFGLYLNQQLQKLSSDQRTLAEKLMSDVLFMARTNQLNTTTQIVSRPSSQATTITSSPFPYVTSPYSQDVVSPPETHFLTPITISNRPVSQNSRHSSSSIQYVSSPYSQDVVSPPDTYISTPVTTSNRPVSQNSAHNSSTPDTHSSNPNTIYKRPLSQNSARTSSPIQYTSSPYVLSTNSTVQYQDIMQELPNTQFSSIPITLDNETENSGPVHTEHTRSILNQMQI